MRLTRFFLGLMLCSIITQSCTKQDLNEDEQLNDNTTVYATGEKPLPPPPPESDPDGN
ncbi:hypothetical protein [Aestuariivivens insulae]|uniref:hypothetical protein n=1 Tax=Aestuariivivens insulae TaxID=1621988 RepID=UPI001F592E03|nr:hypothetical protein [Aestuariivivens insulae]